MLSGALIDKNLGVSHRAARLYTKKNGNGDVSFLISHILAVELGIGRFDIHIEVKFKGFTRNGQFDELKSALVDTVKLFGNSRFEFFETQSVVFKFVVSVLNDFVRSEHFLRERGRRHVFGSVRRGSEFVLRVVEIHGSRRNLVGIIFFLVVKRESEKPLVDKKTLLLDGSDKTVRRDSVIVHVFTRICSHKRTSLIPDNYAGHRKIVRCATQIYLYITIIYYARIFFKRY